MTTILDRLARNADSGLTGSTAVDLATAERPAGSAYLRAATAVLLIRYGATDFLIADANGTYRLSQVRAADVSSLLQCEPRDVVPRMRGAALGVFLPRGGEVQHPAIIVELHGSQLIIRYALEAIDTDEGSALARHLANLVGDVLDRPRALPWQMQMLDQAETAELAGRDRDLPNDLQDVTELFELNVHRSPMAPAVITPSAGMTTYAELESQVRAVAASLGGERAPEQRVAVFVPRSLHTVAAILGILRAGMVYVPVDTSWPDHYVCRIIDTARPAVILTDAAGASRLEKSIQSMDPRPSIKADWSGARLPATEHLRRRVSDDALAAVFFTSGSTGVPKAVLIPHAQLRNRFAWLLEAFPFAPDDVALARTPVGFLPSVPELLGPIISGGRVLIVDEHDAADPRALVATANAYSVTRLVLTPSYLREVLDVLADGEFALPSLKLCSVGGEIVDRRLVRRFYESCPEAILVNQYGATELNDAVVAALPTLAPDTEAVAIGRPIRGNRAHVIDNWGNLVPPGVLGELCVSGLGLSRGYLDDPATTAAAFVPAPLLGGERMYRTGDRVISCRDGVLEFIGREASSEKIAGVKVHPALVECVIRQHDGVRDVAVVACAGRAGAMLCAHVVVAADVSKASIESYIRERLPPPMVPGRIIVIDALPRTLSGKIDRAALIARVAIGDQRTAPSAEAGAGDNIERTLVRMWSRVLGRKVIGLHDNFFELGGHSLFAGRLVGLIRAELGVECSVSSFLKHPTVAELAHEIRVLKTEKALRLLAEVEQMEGAEVKKKLASLASEVTPKGQPTTEQLQSKSI